MELNLTPEQKIKWAIMLKWSNHSPENREQVGNALILVSGSFAEKVEQAYESLKDDMADEIYEFRGGSYDTTCDTEYSRHYEVKGVAAEMPDGSWVGWPHYYGGGKHGEPEAFPWMQAAYEVNHEAKEITITQHTFTKKV